MSPTQLHILKKMPSVADYITYHRAKYGLKLQVKINEIQYKVGSQTLRRANLERYFAL